MKKLVFAVLLALVLCDLAENVYVKNKPIPTSAASVHEWLVSTDLPAGSRAGWLALQYQLSETLGVSMEVSQRILHAAVLFLLFLAPLLFLGVANPWSYLLMPAIYYALYRHEVQYVGRLTDFPVAFTIGVALSLATKQLLSAGGLLWKTLVPYFFLVVLSAFLRENAVLILFFVGAYASWMFFFSKEKAVLFDRKILWFVALGLIGIMLGRLLIRISFPEVESLLWNPTTPGPGPGSPWKDVRAYGPINLAARRDVMLGVASQFGTLLALVFLIVRCARQNESRSIALAALSTIAFQLMVYMIMGNAQGEAEAAMSILALLYVPLGMVLSRCWPRPLSFLDRWKSASAA